MYRGLRLISFADNHDVTRLASNLTNENHLPLAYGMLMAMPGIPCIYYGSEWGIHGRKEDGDAALRPEILQPEYNSLTEFITRAIGAHKSSKALCYGSIAVLHQTNRQIVFEREFEGERVIVMINADENEYVAHYNANAGCGEDMLTGEQFDFGAGSHMPPYSVKYVKVK